MYQRALFFSCGQVEKKERNNRQCDTHNKEQKTTTRTSGRNGLSIDDAAMSDVFLKFHSRVRRSLSSTNSSVPSLNFVDDLLVKAALARYTSPIKVSESQVTVYIYITSSKR
jgi:hypothetical protein